MASHPSTDNSPPPCAISWHRVFGLEQNSVLGQLDIFVKPALKNVFAIQTPKSKSTIGAIRPIALLASEVQVK